MYRMPRVKGGAVSAKLTQEFITASYQDNPPQKIGDFIYDPSVSATTARVYHNPQTGQTILVNRGTKELSDWGNNLAYATGTHKMTKRYKEAEKVQQQAEAKYGAKNISQITHSQGAIYGRDLGKNVKEVISVNPARRGEKERANEYVVRSSADPVSTAFDTAKSVASKGLFGTIFGKKKTDPKSKEKVVKAETSNPLAEHSQKILERLPEGEMLGSGRDFYQHFGGYQYYIPY